MRLVMSADAVVEHLHKAQNRHTHLRCTANAPPPPPPPLLLLVVVVVVYCHQTASQFQSVYVDHRASNIIMLRDIHYYRTIQCDTIGLHKYLSEDLSVKPRQNVQ